MTIVAGERNIKVDLSMLQDRLPADGGANGLLGAGLLPPLSGEHRALQAGVQHPVAGLPQRSQPEQKSLTSVLRFGVLRMLRAGLAPLRLLLRPLAWRSRSFLLGEIHPLLAAINASQTHLLKQVHTLAQNAAQPIHRGEGLAASLRPGAVQLQRKIHQFHAGSEVGDAITNAMLLIQRQLRGLGYVSDIFVEHIGAGLAETVQPLAALPLQDDYVLLVHHSMGHAGFAQVCASPARKILIYHNITPSDLLEHNRPLRDAGELGRRQLLLWRDQVVAAVADSVFNGVELRRLGFASVLEASLLFDLDEMGGNCRHVPRSSANNAIYTVLFVGRLAPSKGQMALVEAFAQFASMLAQQTGRSARLVLVGGEQICAPGYRAALQGLAWEHGLADQVLITGKISDAALHEWYRAADLYVSLSQHEGFGVPLVEAMTHGLPVLALRAGAVAETLGAHGGLLDEDAAIMVAKKMLSMAVNADAAAALVAAQREQLARFRLPAHWAVLQQALLLAGLPPPVASMTRDIVRQTMRLVLSVDDDAHHPIRRLAETLAQTRSAQLVVEEGARRWADPSALSVLLRSENARLLSSAAPCLVLVDGPAQRIGLARVRKFNTQASGVIAPNTAVAQALISSGVHVPIHVVAPEGGARVWGEQIVDLAADCLLSPPPRRLRLGWLTPWHACNGMAVQSRQLVSSFARIAAAPIGLSAIFCEQAAGERCREFAPALPLHAALHPSPTREQMAALAHSISAQDPDVLVIQHDPVLLPWNELADLLASPQLRHRMVVVHLHAAHELPELDYALCRRLCAALAQTGRVLTPHASELGMLADFGVPNSDCLPYGAAVALPPRLPRALGGADAPLIGCVGYLLPQLGLRALLHAASLLRSRWPQLRLRLLTARHADPASDIEFRACLGLIHSLQLSGHVEWNTDFLPSEDVSEQLHACDLVVLPSAVARSDASLAARMAIASGAPTLIASRSDSDDLGDSVRRMSSVAPQAMAIEMENLLRSPDHRAVLQQQAQAWLAEHAWEVVAERLQGMLVGLHGARTQWAAAGSLTPSP